MNYIYILLVFRRFSFLKEYYILLWYGMLLFWRGNAFVNRDKRNLHISVGDMTTVIVTNATKLVPKCISLCLSIRQFWHKEKRDVLHRQLEKNPDPVCTLKMALQRHLQCYNITVSWISHAKTSKQAYSLWRLMDTTHCTYWSVWK